MFYVAERSIGAVCFWNNPPPSPQWTPLGLSSVEVDFNLLSDAPSPSRRQSIGRTEGHSHFWLLDQIQVVAVDSDDPPSAVRTRHFNTIKFKHRSSIFMGSFYTFLPKKKVSINLHHALLLLLMPCDSILYTTIGTR